MHNLIYNVMQPVVTRLGTAAASVLVGYGVASGDALTVGKAVTIAGLFALDLLIKAWLARGDK